MVVSTVLSPCLCSTAFIFSSDIYLDFFDFLVAVCMDVSSLSLCYVVFAACLCHRMSRMRSGMWWDAQKTGNLPLSPQWDVRTWKSVSTPQETPSSWSFCDPTLTPSLRATSWAMAAACSPNSSFSCRRTVSRMKRSLVRKSNDVQYVCQDEKQLAVKRICKFYFQLFN